MLQDILDDKFWGCVEVDIEVPEYLYEYFLIMPPLFINATYSSSIAGEYMNWLITERLKKKHTTNRKLIATMRAKKILLKSNLLKWYLQHGLRFMMDLLIGLVTQDA